MNTAEDLGGVLDERRAKYQPTQAESARNTARFRQIVEADPTIPTEEAAKQSGVGHTKAHKLRKEIIAECGESFRPRHRKRTVRVNTEPIDVRRVKAILHDRPEIRTSDLAREAGVSASKAARVRAEMVKEHGQRYATPKRQTLTMAAQAKRVLRSMALSLESFATVGIEDLDPTRVDLSNAETLEDLRVIQKSLPVLDRFAKSVEAHRKAQPTNNVVTGNFGTKETSA